MDFHHQTHRGTRDARTKLIWLLRLMRDEGSLSEPFGNARFLEALLALVVPKTQENILQILCLCEHVSRPYSKDDGDCRTLFRSLFI